MFVIVRTERPRDEVAPFILPKISAATGGDVVSKAMIANCRKMSLRIDRLMCSHNILRLFLDYSR